MTGPDIDYAAAFDVAPSPVLLVSPHLVILDANRAYERVSGRSRQELRGQYIFDAFPDNPEDPGTTGERNLRASLLRVLETGQADTMALQKYDVERPDMSGVFEERWWSPLNVPILGEDGHVVMILHRVEEVTVLMRDRKRRHEPTQGWNTQRDLMEAELYNRAIELQELNESLREAHAREREVGLALQQAMLPAPGSEQYPYAAVRYLPAVGTLNVCGDWYEIVGLGGGRYAVAVGDVVGQGLSAAGVMGQLRSALSAAIRAVESPARALEILGLYAGSVEGALTATAVQAVIDRDAASIVYSRAGHLPPMLVHMDGLVEVLDEVTDPPLGTLPADAVMSEAVTSYAEGDTLVLYTDGLIERRGEDIDVGLGRLVDSLTRHCCRGPEPMADALLRDLEASGGTGDDTALIVVRLPPTDGGRPSAGGRG